MAQSADVRDSGSIIIEKNYMNENIILRFFKEFCSSKTCQTKVLILTLMFVA